MLADAVDERSFDLDAARNHFQAWHYSASTKQRGDHDDRCMSVGAGGYGDVDADVDLVAVEAALAYLIGSVAFHQGKKVGDFGTVHKMKD